MIPFFALRFVDINDQMRFINLKKKRTKKMGIRKHKELSSNKSIVRAFVVAKK